MSSGSHLVERLEVKCNQIAKSRNLTLSIAPGYQGIPENLLMNFLAWMGLMGAYSALTWASNHYSQTILVDSSDKFSDRIYGERYRRKCDKAPLVEKVQHIFSAKNKADEGQGIRFSEEAESEDWSESVRTPFNIIAWIRAVWSVDDLRVLKRNGPDAVQYLTFQRYIILFVYVVCVCVIAIVLPLNTFGVESQRNNKFAQTTISNLSKNSPSLWTHIALSLFFLPLGLSVMRRFSSRLLIDTKERRIERSLMIAQVPQEHCRVELFRQLFAETYPECRLQDIQFAYDIRELLHLTGRRETATQARLWCERHINSTRSRPKMRPYFGGRFCYYGHYGIGLREVDALDYYKAEESQLMARLAEERRRALTRPAGFAFVTFETEAMAMSVCREYRTRWRHKEGASTCEPRPALWKVMFAPPPSDILWENLCPAGWNWCVGAVLVNFLLVIVLFFLTTPVVMLTLLAPLLNVRLGANLYVEKFLPPLLLQIVTGLMPALVASSDDLVRHWARSARNHVIMKKTFIFLLFMVLILPSLGVSTAEAFLGRLMRSQNATEVWNCIYLPDSGAFFINYVITSSFIGNSVELMRLNQILLLGFHALSTRSKAERYTVLRNAALEFCFGLNYAWFLLMFAIIMVYSIPCPLLTPFGVLYLNFKHLVDKYNIYFVYGPSKTNKYIHETAIEFVTFSLILPQFPLFVYLYIKSDNTVYALAMCGIFMMSLCLFISQNVMKFFRDFGPIKYVRNLQKRFERHRLIDPRLQPQPDLYTAEALKENTASHLPTTKTTTPTKSARATARDDVNGR